MTLDEVLNRAGPMNRAVRWNLRTASARVHQEWWANKDPNDTPPPHSRSWTLASRTATPNLQAQTVVLERSATLTITRGDFLTRPSLIHPFTPIWSRHP